MDYRAYRIAASEADFKQNLVDAYGKKWTASPGEFANVIRLQTAESHNFYYSQAVSKLACVVHSTAGLLKADIGALSQPNNHVSVAFVIARDGTIYQLFPSEAWSYHLGPTSSANNPYWSQHSVAIELSSIGALKEDPDDVNTLIDVYGKPYCTKLDTQYYAAHPYRGYNFFATYSDAQYSSLNSLLINITKKYSIPFTKLPKPHAYDWLPTAPSVGIWSHVNCRKDKLDLPVIFDWDRITGLEAAESPPAPPPAPKIVNLVYNIQAGDTLYKIAQQHSLTLATLEAANPGIDYNNLQIGQAINIPS